MAVAKFVEYFQTLGGQASLNSFRALNFLLTMYRNNQQFTFHRNKTGLPSLESYNYLPGKTMSRNGIRYLAKRLRKAGAIQVVGTYHVEQFHGTCTIYKIVPEYGLFLTNIAQALQTTDKQFAEIRARQEVRW